MNCFSMRRDHQIEEIKTLYNSKRSEIKLKLHEFKKTWATGTREEIFSELVFCLLTPMSRGKSCWASVENMVRKKVLFKGDSAQIVKELDGVRFIYKKSRYIVEARKKFLLDNKISLKSIIGKINDGYEAREWLVQNVKGMGSKEASHFLRNIGFEQNLAILDRHILKNLQLIGVIEEIPYSLSKRRYLDIEKRMIEFSKAVRIPMSHLDLVMWCKETGEIFK